MRKEIFSIRVANELVRLGHKIIDVRLNYKDPKLRVFIFNETEQLKKDLEDIFKK